MDQSPQRTYICIDLKSFYASVECMDRGLDPLTTNLVVADLSRTEKTICLAVSPSLKAHGISGRARLFEVVERVKEVNAGRLRDAIRRGAAVKGEQGKYGFAGSSFHSEELAADPSLELSYIVAPPRMKLYEKVSTQIFTIYSKFVSPDDIHVYSIDECFMDVTGYLDLYRTTAHELAIRMIREVLAATGITATAGVGTNMYLAKVAMDIVAKHVPADADGVRIATLDEQSYRELLWCHRPLTDFWRVGRGISRKLESMGIFTMGDIARQSVRDENVLYRAFGINAELLIDHAWGWEPTEIATVKSYRPETSSLSSGQVLKEPYNYEQTRLIVREMTDLLALDLVRKGMVTKQVTLTINYDRTSLIPERQGRTLKDSTFRVASTGRRYTGEVAQDPYGRLCPKHAHGTGNLDHYTSSARALIDTMTEVYDRIMDPDLLARRVTVVAVEMIPESMIPEEAPEQLKLFTDYGKLEREKAARDAAEARERRMQKATVQLQERFGKNVVLKGMNFLEGGTTRERNAQIGGHRAGSDGTEE